MASFKVMKDSIQRYMQTVDQMLALVDAGHKEEFNDVLRKDLRLYAFLSYNKFAEHVNRFEDSVANDAYRRYRLALRNGCLLQIVLFLITGACPDLYDVSLQ